MATHSSIILYCHIGSHISAALRALAHHVTSTLFTLFALVIAMGFVLSLFLPFINVAQICAVEWGWLTQK